jgi:CHAD domain-containing protein
MWLAAFGRMRSSETMVEALREVVEPGVKKLRKKLKKASAGKPDGVHGGRTELRRLRTELSIMGDTVFDTSKIEPICEQMHDLERSLAKARDTDVLLEHLDDHLAKRPRDQAGLKDVRRRLGRRRDEAARAAKRALAPKTRRRVIDALRDLLQKRSSVVARSPNHPAKAAPLLVRHFTREEIWHRYDALRAFDARPSSDIETLHKVRSQCRQLRFALEAFEGALPASAPIARELHLLQDEIGEVHDHQVAIDLLGRWREEGKVASNESLDRYLAARAKARDRLQARYGRHWRTVFGPAFRRRLAHALEREAA